MRRMGTLALMATGAILAMNLGPANATTLIPSSTSTADLQAILDNSPSGSTVTLGPGSFSVTNPLKVPTGVSIAGSGTDATVLKLAAGAWSAFSYGFVVAANGSGSTVRDLTIDGNRSGTASPPANSGGGLKVGSGWTVSNVRFTNLNYFKVWIMGVSDVTVRNCRFDAIGGSSGGEDNVGGGRSSNVTIADNHFDATTRGNAIDLLRSQNLTITGNVLRGAPRVERNIYLEGVQGATVSGNSLAYGSITAQTDKSYSGTEPITNPKDIVIRDNVVTDSVSQGIAIVYDTHTRGMRTGGGNEVSGNIVSKTGRTGIVIIHCAPDAATTADRITGNIVTDGFTRGEVSWGTGCGTVQPSGIAITAGRGTVITGNSIIDTRTPTMMKYGVWAGARNARALLVNPTISDNLVSASLTVSGVQV